MFNDFKYESKINSQCNYKRWQLLRVTKKKRVKILLMNKISFHQNTDDVTNYQNVVQRQFTRGTLHQSKGR